MNKRTAAMIAELLPVVSAILFFLLVGSASDSALVRRLIPLALLPAIFAFGL